MADNELLSLPKKSLTSCQVQPRQVESYHANVTVERDIARAWLKVRGHLILMGECDGSRLETELGSIFLLYGSTKKTTLAAGANIYVKHALDADLEARQDVVIENSVLNSRISAGKRIISEHSDGRIVGGACRAGAFIDICSLGHTSEAPTEVAITSPEGGILVREIHPQTLIVIGETRQKIHRRIVAETPVWLFAQDRRIYLARGRRIPDGKGGTIFMPTESRPLA